MAKKETMASKISKATYDRIISYNEENAEREIKDLRFKLWFTSGAAAVLFFIVATFLVNYFSGGSP